MRKRKDRLARRTLLATLLASACIGFLGRELDFDGQAALGFVVASVVMVAACILVALIWVVILKTLQRWRRSL